MSLEHVKAGDHVILWEAVGLVRGSCLRRVDRTTATQIILNDHERYSRKTGIRIGHYSQWRVPWIEEATPERIAEVTAAVELRARNRRTDNRIEVICKALVEAQRWPIEEKARLVRELIAGLPGDVRDKLFGKESNGEAAP